MDYMRIIKGSSAVYLITSASLVEYLVKPRQGSLISLYGLVILLAPPLLFALGLVVFGIAMKFASDFKNPARALKNGSDYYVIHEKSLEAKYRGKQIPMQVAYEAYLAQKLDFKVDVYTLLKNYRHELFQYNLTWDHFVFFLTTFVPNVLNHSKSMDGEEVKPVYNRGNDFYRWFLGESMIYTTGIFASSTLDSLEEAQERKMHTLCQKLDLKPGDTLLDIGCGWGTLARFAAKRYGARVLGITICQEQVKWAQEGIEKDGTGERCQVRLLDYRDIPEIKFNKIVCVEMAEHVGVLRFQKFLRLVKDRMEDDGIFVLQIAGLRRAWRFEDFVWGFYMNAYIFPAADASCPLGWTTNQLESAGFEIWTTQNVGIHYSHTLKRWYDNWISNRESVIAKYGEWWYRQWVMFLSWSSVIAAQGSSTCWQITLHKNLDHVPRERYINATCHGVMETRARPVTLAN